MLYKIICIKWSQNSIERHSATIWHLTSSKPSTCIHVIFFQKNVYFHGTFSLVWVWNGPRTEFMHLF